MTDQEILDKAIQQAIDGGCNDLMAIGVYTLEKNKRGTYGLRSVTDGWINVEAIIYNHDFAKALWGDDLYEWKDDYFSGAILCYLYHLQQMVIAEDPIKYLGENI